MLISTLNRLQLLLLCAYTLTSRVCTHRFWRVDISAHVWFIKGCLFLITLNWSSCECRAKTCDHSQIACIMGTSTTEEIIGICINCKWFEYVFHFIHSVRPHPLSYMNIYWKLNTYGIPFFVLGNLRAPSLCQSPWVRLNLPCCDRQEGGIKRTAKQCEIRTSCVHVCVCWRTYFLLVCAQCVS